MKFAIATVTFWQSVGFNTDNWRKSVDGTQAIVHLQYAEIMLSDIRSNPNVQVHTSPSNELTALLNSSAWTEVV